MGRTAAPALQVLPDGSTRVLPRVISTKSSTTIWSGESSCGEVRLALPEALGTLQPFREGTSSWGSSAPLPSISVLSPRTSTRPSCFPKTTLLTCPPEGHSKPVPRPKVPVLTVTAFPSYREKGSASAGLVLLSNHDTGQSMSPRQTPTLCEYLRESREGLVLVSPTNTSQCQPHDSGCCAAGVKSLAGTLLAPLVPVRPTLHQDPRFLSPGEGKLRLAAQEGNQDPREQPPHKTGEQETQ